MLDIIIIGKNLKYCINLINYLCSKNNKIRIIAIYNNIEDLFIFFEKNSIDAILINNEKMEYNKILENRVMQQYLHYTIFISNNSKVNEKLQLCNIYGVINNADNFKGISDLVNNLYFDKLGEDYYYEKIDTNKRKVIIDKIENELKSLNIRVSYVGIKYLIEATYILYNFEDFNDYNLEKDIYPIISHKYRKSINNIKSNICYAVNILYVECEEKKLKAYIEEYNIHRPSPKKFISAIVKRIKFNNVLL